MIPPKEKEHSKFNMKFPEKLFNIVNNCVSGAIGWSSAGDSIVMEYVRFKKEYLNDKSDVFKTNNLTSFVRQLNLYGFKKCNRLFDDAHEFKHPFFIKDRKDLLNFIQRKPGSVKDYDNLTPKRKKHKKLSLLKVSKYEHINEKDGTFNQGQTPPIHSHASLSYHQTFNKNYKEGSSFNELANVSVPTISWCNNGWLPADAEYYKSLKQESGDSNNEANKENVIPKSQVEENNLPNAINGDKNLYYIIMPGYVLQQYSHLFANQELFRNIRPFTGFPLGHSNHIKVSDMFSDKKKQDNTD